ncbi:protein of unknown function [Hyphomicrobium sp. MC1]|nr:protein of unknown function [Hyphomicrobium sp. MC1]
MWGGVVASGPLPFSPVLLPEPELAGKLISGGGCLLIGTSGEVGDTTALFSLPGPTLPGSIVFAAFGALLLAASAKAGSELPSAAAAIAAAMRSFVLMNIFSFRCSMSIQRMAQRRCSRGSPEL